jgi:cysteine-rich repeat protein
MIIRIASGVSRDASKESHVMDSRVRCTSPPETPAIQRRIQRCVPASLVLLPLLVIGVTQGISEAVDCDRFPDGLLIFETAASGTGSCGLLENFRCSNDANKACATAADCGAANTCNHVIGGGLPLDLWCGKLYTGGGLASTPQAVSVPDGGAILSKVISSCRAGALITRAVTGAEAGSLTCSEGRKCTGNNAVCVFDSDCPGAQTCEPRCLFGAPLPVPNAMTPPISVCTIDTFAEDITGTGACEGDSTVDVSLDVSLRREVYLSGDLLPNVPGIQPCPLCTRQCAGGTKGRFRCDADGDCPGSTCTTGTFCLGGHADGLACAPGTSDSAALGDVQGAFPTSHDCPPERWTSITSAIGGLPVDLQLTTGTQVKQGQDLNAGAGGQRVFSGFCRDSLDPGGSHCFEGDSDVACPGATPPAAGNALPCDSNADCADGDWYESCAQRSPGAFAKGAATRISVHGSTGGADLADGQAHSVNLVGAFDIPPTFDATIDGAYDLPGPGAVLLAGDLRIECSAPPTTTTTTPTLPPTTMTLAPTTSTQPPPTSTSVPLPTTTTLPAGSECGNGIVESGEQCDDGNLLENDCCVARCTRVLRVGTPCGSDVEAGDCDRPDSCDSEGRCRANLEPRGTPCRAAKVLGECDAGGTCDGASPECPAEGFAPFGTACRDVGTFGGCDPGGRCSGESHECSLDGLAIGCTAEVPDTARKEIPVTCTAQADTVQGGRASCEAVGYEALSASAEALRGVGSAGATADVEVDELQPGEQVTKLRKRTLKLRRKTGTKQGILKLKLNRVGNSLLKKQGTLRVLVETRILPGDGSVETLRRLVTLVSQKR